MVGYQLFTSSRMLIPMAVPMPSGVTMEATRDSVLPIENFVKFFVSKLQRDNRDRDRDTSGIILNTVHWHRRLRVPRRRPHSAYVRHRIEQNSMPGDGTGAGTDKAAGYTRRRNMKKVRRL